MTTNIELSSLLKELAASLPEAVKIRLKQDNLTSII